MPRPKPLCRASLSLHVAFHVIALCRCRCLLLQPWQCSVSCSHAPSWWQFRLLSLTPQCFNCYPICPCWLTLLHWQERKAAVIRAEGESESARLISDATRTAGPGLIELRRIEAAKDVASTLSRSGNVVYLPHGNNMLLGLNPSMGGR